MKISKPIKILIIAMTILMLQIIASATFILLYHKWEGIVYMDGFKQGYKVAKDKCLNDY